VKLRQWPKVSHWLDLLLLRQWPEKELTEAVTRALLSTLRRMTSLLKFPGLHEFSLTNFCVSCDVANFRRTTSGAGLQRLQWSYSALHRSPKSFCNAFRLCLFKSWILLI